MGGRESETHCINLRAAPLPQGNLSGRSNVFPNITSSAHTGFRNLPLPPPEKETRQSFVPSQNKTQIVFLGLSCGINAPNLNAPRNTLSLRRAEVRVASAPTATAMAIAVV